MEPRRIQLSARADRPTPERWTDPVIGGAGGFVIAGVLWAVASALYGLATETIAGLWMAFLFGPPVATAGAIAGAVVARRRARRADRYGPV